MSTEDHTAKELQPVLDEYIKILFFPTVLATIFAIAVQQTPYPTLLEVVAHAGLIIYLLVVIYRHKDTFEWPTVALLGGIAGAFTGFLTALYKLLTAFDVPAIFALITEPAFAGVLDSIAAAFLYILIHVIPHRKGGETHGNS